MTRRATELSEELGEAVSAGFEVFTARPQRHLQEEREWTFIRRDGARVPALLTVSALLGRNVAKVLDTAQQVADARATRMPTAALNLVLREAVTSHPPAMHRGRRVKILYCAQASSPNPTVGLFVNDPELLHFSYQRYLENRIRAVFGFAGVRLHMVIRRRADSEG